MTELDFDELDKAVNDLMQDTNPVHAAVPVSVAGTDSPVADASAASQPADVPLAIKRRGRFMDVMAPAGAKKPTIDAPVKRQGITITAPDIEQSSQTQDNSEQPAIEIPSVEPIDVQAATSEVPAVMTVTEDESPEEPMANNAPDVQTSESGYAANPAPVAAWPEETEDALHGSNDIENVPVDTQVSPTEPNDTDTTSMASDDNDAQSDIPEDNEVEISEPVNVPAETTSQSDEQLTTVVAPDNNPAEDSAVALPESVMASPFLPDTKVEKRPLGGADQLNLDATDQTASTTVELPREYNSDIMNLDTDTSTVASQPSPDGATQVATPGDVKSENKPAASVSAPITAAAGTMAGTIFDTDAYHTPLKHPAKTKSAWVVIIWLLVLLIVGAAAGAAYYYFTTQ